MEPKQPSVDSLEHSISRIRIQGFLLWRVETTIPGPGGTLNIGPRVSVWWFFPQPWGMSSLICTDQPETPREPLTPSPKLCLCAALFPLGPHSANPTCLDLPVGSPRVPLPHAAPWTLTPGLKQGQAQGLLPVFPLLRIPVTCCLMPEVWKMSHFFFLWFYTCLRKSRVLAHSGCHNLIPQAGEGRLINNRNLQD